VPVQFRHQVVRQYHDDIGHMGIDKTFDAIRQRDFWPNMYKQLYQYSNKCVPCQQRNLTKHKVPLQETDIPPYPFAKIALDLSGPYPTTLVENKYIVGFIVIYSGWLEAYTVPDKCAETITHF